MAVLVLEITGRPVFCTVELAADDRLDAGLTTCIMELYHSVHVPMVRKGYRLHSQFLATFHISLDGSHAVKHRIVAVAMEVYERYRHSIFSLKQRTGRTHVIYVRTDNYSMLHK